MKLLELTDFFTKTKKEYVVVENIVHFEPYTRKYEHIKTDEREVTIVPSFLAEIFGKKSVTVKEKFTVSREVVDRNGSKVILSNKTQTMVLETPEEIAKMLSEGKFTEVKGG